MTAGSLERAGAQARRLPVAGLIIATAIGLVGILIRLTALTGQSLWYDEGFSVYLSGGGPDGGPVSRLLSAPGSDAFQPLHPLLLAGWRAAFGSSEVSLRMSSVVVGVGLLILVWWAARDLFGPRHALWSLGLAACASILVQYSQEVRPYAVVALVGTAEVVAYLRLLRSRPDETRRRWYAFGVLVVVGLITSLLLWVLAAALLATDVIVRRDRRVIGTWWPIGVGALVAGAYEIAMIVTRSNWREISSLTGPIVLNLAYALYALVAGPSFGPAPEAIRADGLQAFNGWWPAIALLGVATAIASVTALLGVIGAPAGSDRRRTGLALALVVVVAIGGAAVFTVVSQLNLQPRHVIYLVGPICLLLPFAVVASDRSSGEVGRSDPDRGRRWERIRTTAGGIALLGLIGLNLVSVSHYLFGQQYARDDYRAAAAYLAAHASEGPSVLLWGRDDLLAYYGDTVTKDAMYLPRDDRLGDGIRGLVGTPPRLFLAINRPYYFADDPEATVGAALGPAYRLAGRQSFQNWTILEYARPEGRSPVAAGPD